MTMRYDIIATGSSGNSSLFRLNDQYIFIDIGVPLNRVTPFMPDKNSLVGEITLFITHEHTDHISGLAPFINRYSPKIYSSQKTIDYLTAKGYPEDMFFEITEDIEYEFNNFSVKPFRITHDAQHPLGFTLNFNGFRFGYATDLGVVSDYVLRALEGSQSILLESNYDEELLQNSEYPRYLKSRIASKYGHLSNKDAYKLISELSSTGLKNAFLGHVSENCNDYELLEKYARSCSEDYQVETKVVRQRTNFSVI